MSGFLIALLAGAAAGVLSGWGVGGGSLLLIYMANFTSLAQSAAQGVNLLFFLPAAAGALRSHMKNGYIVWKGVLYASATGLVAALLLSLFATAQDNGFLRKCFGFFLTATGLIQFLSVKKAKKEEPETKR